MNHRMKCGTLFTANTVFLIWTHNRMCFCSRVTYMTYDSYDAWIISWWDEARAWLCYKGAIDNEAVKFVIAGAPHITESEKNKTLSSDRHVDVMKGHQCRWMPVDWSGCRRVKFPRDGADDTLVLDLQDTSLWGPQEVQILLKYTAYIRNHEKDPGLCLIQKTHTLFESSL